MDRKILRLALVIAVSLLSLIHISVIVRKTITAGIGNIKFSIFYYHFFRLIADYHFTGYSQTCRIHFNHFSRTRIGIYSDRACIRTYISLSIIKSDIPAICHIYLPQMLCRFHIHHLYKIRAIDYGLSLIHISLLSKRGE